MIILGLTGSIAMGKSTASAMLVEMGVNVHDSDVAVHEIYRSDQSFIQSVRTHFPIAYSARTGRINRVALGEIIFNDRAKKQLLESLLHPKVRQAQNSFMKKCRRLRQNLVALDIPLLFETGAENRCDQVIVVSAPAHIQKARVLARPNMSEEKLARILAAQMPDSEKRVRADFVVNSGLGRAYMQRELKSIIRKLQSPVQPVEQAY